jgi:hypothetical protein
LKAITGLLLSVLLLYGQRLTWYERLVLLREPQPVSGIVVDSAGNPIAGAHVDHTDVKAQEQLFTDEQGRFRFLTGAPAIVVRKLGFNGQRIRLDSSASFKIVLSPATKTMPTCKLKCEALSSSGSAICLPRAPGIQVSEQGTYDETVTQMFRLQTRDGQRELLHGSGPMWSLGVPFTGDVWESIEYQESAYLVGTGDSDVVDARGKTPDGKLWRYLGRFGESASYYEVDDAGAALLDRVLDGACIATSPH